MNNILPYAIGVFIFAYLTLAALAICCPMRLIRALNILFLQWLGVRLAATGPATEPFKPSGFGLMIGVVPLTGWWSPFIGPRWMTKFHSDLLDVVSLPLFLICFGSELLTLYSHNCLSTAIIAAMLLYSSHNVIKGLSA
jgi:hypothetical protein